MPLLLLPPLLPILAVPVCYGLSRRKPARAIYAMIAVSAAVLAILLILLARSAEAPHLVLPSVCGMGIVLRADGFRALYALVAGVMWLVTSLFSRDYFAREHNVGRYTVFIMLTFGATVGLFLTDTLYGAFLFFEVMSLSSYPWVAQEETPEAMRAAETYLYVAIIGGLVMLMGLLLLPQGFASASFAELPALAASQGTDALWLPACLLLFGFGAKAGAFPLHIWLPKAHPVAPAPASALLSGMLTKAGVFGMLVLTCWLMRGCSQWGDLILRLGVITMTLGALLAIFSVNLKRTLACSSLSQIGFIMIGVGLCGLLRNENGLAAFGTVQHMLNHSLIKLVLFLCAGVVAMNVHSLTLDDIRGFGRRKPALHAAFLLGALGVSGVPLFCGYISKSMLHEALLEYIAQLEAANLSASAYSVAEGLFIISGGMTLCYMLKLYLCLFWQKHPTRQAEYDAQKRYLSQSSKAALLICAAYMPLAGLLPGILMTGVGKLSLPFLNAAKPELPILYYSAENLLGAAKSLLIGGALYALVRLMLTQKDEAGGRRYLNHWPKWLDLETLLYRPLLRLLAALGGALAVSLDKLADGLFAALNGLGALIAHTLNLSPDYLSLAARKTVLSNRKPSREAPVGTRFTYALGRSLDQIITIINKTLRRHNPIQKSFVTLFAAGQKEASAEFFRLTRSVSFGLLMFCLGLYFTLAYLLM